jgi:GNAT superfamily N-acetyltransferase
LKGIANIYNHYTQYPHSIVTEDQAAISEDDVAFLINHTKGEKLPIIVAVRGRMPLPLQNKSQNRAQQNGKAPLPQFEGIIGFGYAETYCYGIGGGRVGRTRFTANIHFYVHPENTGKKIGRSLLDRLIKSLSHGYG